MPSAGHGPAPLGLQVIGCRSWGRAMPCQRGRFIAFFKQAPRQAVTAGDNERP